MLKKLIFNIVIVTILIMVGMAIIKVNKPKHTVLKNALIEQPIKKTSLIPKEAKYYKVIEE